MRITHTDGYYHIFYGNKLLESFQTIEELSSFLDELGTV